MTSGVQEHMLRAAVCQSSGELLYQCDTWYMSFCVDDRLVCRSICSCTPDDHLHRVTKTRCCIDAIILLMMGTWLPDTCRKQININEKLCVDLVIYKDHARMHRQQNIRNKLVVLTDGHQVFLLCMVKLATVCHMYRFCFYVRKGNQEINGKILLLLLLLLL